MSKKKKKPQNVNQPSFSKKPRGGGKTEEISDKAISWRLGIMDREGPFGWGTINHNVFWKRIQPPLSNFETMTWNEIIGDKNHSIPVDQLSKKAQKRLEEIGQDDIDQLISLRFSNKERLWGIKDKNSLKILWWDPEHKGYETKKNNT